MAGKKDWRKQLGDLVHRRDTVIERIENEKQVGRYVIMDIIRSALEEIKGELEIHSYEVYYTEDSQGFYPHADLTLRRNGVTVMVYRIRISLDDPDRYKIEPLYGTSSEKVVEYGTTWILKTNEYGLSKETIISNFIACYEDKISRIIQNNPGQE